MTKKQVALIAMLVQQALFTHANGAVDNKGRSLTISDKQQIACCCNKIAANRLLW